MGVHLTQATDNPLRREIDASYPLPVAPKETRLRLAPAIALYIADLRMTAARLQGALEAARSLVEYLQSENDRLRKDG